MIFSRYSLARFSTSIPSWATVNPYTLSRNHPHTVDNIINGNIHRTDNLAKVIDPLNGEEFINVSKIDGSLEQEVINSQNSCPRYGLHNPIKNVHRYNMYGDIFFRIAQEMRKKQTQDFFVKLIQRVMPKSTAQCLGEYVVTRKFFENFTGDNPRFTFRSFGVTGDHDGQYSTGYRWPYGNVAVITPFNFPIEIPCLQTFGAVLAGNKPLLKCDTKVAVCMEQFLLMAHACGMPKEDINFVNCADPTTEHLIEKANFRLVQFTGSSRVAEILAKKTNGRVKIEDAGFDWKVLGPDVKNLDYVAWQSDQDAYAASGQKCSAQSVIFVHENWIQAGFIQKMRQLAERRNLHDLTIGPVLTWNNKQIKAHINALLNLNDVEVLFGGEELTRHSIPEVYGSYKPTAVQVPLKTFLNNFELCSTELFGPFQVVVPYNSNDTNHVVEALSRMKHNLTAAVVSNDPQFLDQILGVTINGTTYAGIRARTTGAPQNHFFGPCGDPRGAGIGTPEAIINVWTSHREVVRDHGEIDPNWKIPPPS